jgi:putative DNA methylase
MTPRKKLIEVALPLDAINAASVREKSIRHGHPSMLHLWWARRPLAVARAVIFAQMVDDPSSYQGHFPSEEALEAERQRLFRLIEQLVQWENTTNEKLLDQAHEEIWNSWRATCAEHQDHPRAKELFNPEKLPAFHDPFAGGGSLPLEAQRLGLESYASDLNPVAVLICKAMIEIPPRFAGRAPVNPESRKNKDLIKKHWRGAEGLAEDVRYYGQWMRDEAEKRIGQLYPKVEITAEMAKERPDLKHYVGKKLTVIAWLWARTVKSPNPAFAHVDVPLNSTFMLSTKAGKEAYVEPAVGNNSYRFRVRVGKPMDNEAAKNGTKLSRGANFRCLMSGTPIAPDYIEAEGKAGRIGERLMAIVAEGDGGRVYLPPSEVMEAVAHQAKPGWKPDVVISGTTRYVGVKLFGMEQFSQLFTDRQLLALTTFSDLIQQVRESVRADACAADGRADSQEYAKAIAMYLAFQIDQLANHLSKICAWHVNNEQLKNTFARQALPMTWDYAETNPFSNSTGSLRNLQDRQIKGIYSLVPAGRGRAWQADARATGDGPQMVISTDPPYYDNVPYADISDFFYVWLRRSLKSVFPELFATVTVPKAEELVVFPHRHRDMDAAKEFFLDGMTQAMQRLAGQMHPAFPVTIYYAFRQSETRDDEGTASTGWETFLDAVIRAGFALSGTWPIRTEQTAALKTTRNALASSIILVCRKRAADAPTVTRREFVAGLKAELPEALRHLQRSNIAPVDLAQAAIGPGMAVFTRYARVLNVEGQPLSVREALALINQGLDEVLTDQEGDFDADSRWALAWFEQSGFDDGEYGVAETLSKAKNTSVTGMVEAGILVSKGGRVRLLRPDELPASWKPETDLRLTAWESVQYLVRALETGGENAAAELVTKIGSKAEIARELAYRLYTVCERKKRAQEALSYNGLVQSWPEITRLARERGKPQQSQPQLFNQE